MISKIIYILTGLVFVLGGVLKWVALPPFEFQIVKDGLADWNWVGYFSRFITGAEIILGLILILYKPLRKAVSFPVIAMLLAFTGYLVFTLVKYGPAGNCGCFGEAIPVSTDASIIKNLINIVLLIWAVAKDREPLIVNWRFPLLTAMVVYSLLFILTPLRQYVKPADETPIQRPAEVKDTAVVKPEIIEGAETKDQKKIAVDSSVKKEEAKPRETLYPQNKSIFANYTSYSDGVYNPDEGEKIVALFSLDCDHCLDAATKMAKQRNSLPQILILYFGEPEQVGAFVSQSGLNAPYIILPPEEFFPLLKQAPPRIVRLVNGNAVEEMNF